jgi:hypothetical protein
MITIVSNSGTEFLMPDDAKIVALKPTFAWNFFMYARQLCGDTDALMQSLNCVHIFKKGI